MFFANSRKYLVLGASENPQKFGYKVLKWYLGRKVPVSPINPKSSTILDVKCYTDINTFIRENTITDAGLGISVIVPPSVALSAFQDVVKMGNASQVKSVWFQPGSFDNEVVNYVSNHFQLDELVADGDCILISSVRKMNEL